ELDGLHAAGELIACGRLHRHSPKQPGQRRLLNEQRLLLAQKAGVRRVERMPRGEQLMRRAGEPRAAAPGTAGRGFQQRRVREVACVFQQQPRALVAQARGARGAVDRSRVLQRLQQREEARIEPAGELQIATEQRVIVHSINATDFTCAHTAWPGASCSVFADCRGRRASRAAEPMRTRTSASAGWASSAMASTTPGSWLTMLLPASCVRARLTSRASTRT